MTFASTVILIEQLSVILPKSKEPMISPMPRPNMHSKAIDVFSYSLMDVISTMVSFMRMMKTEE